MSSVATVEEVITYLRSQDYPDDAIAVLMNASRIEPPEGNFLRWSTVAVQHVAGPPPKKPKR